MLYHVFSTGGVITLMNVASTNLEITNVTQAIVSHTHQCLEGTGDRQLFFCKLFLSWCAYTNIIFGWLYVCICPNNLICAQTHSIPMTVRPRQLQREAQNFICASPVTTLLLFLGWLTHLPPVGNLHTCCSSPATSCSSLKLQFSSHSLPDCLCTHASLTSTHPWTGSPLLTQFVHVPASLWLITLLWRVLALVLFLCLDPGILIPLLTWTSSQPVSLVLIVVNGCLATGSCLQLCDNLCTLNWPTTALSLLHGRLSLHSWLLGCWAVACTVTIKILRLWIKNSLMNVSRNWKFSLLNSSEISHSLSLSRDIYDEWLWHMRRQWSR